MTRTAEDERRSRHQSPTSERLMTVEEVAEFLSVPVATLYQWRHKGTGPTAFRVGRFLRYDLSDVRDWLHAHAGARDGTR